MYRHSRSIPQTPYLESSDLNGVGTRETKCAERKGRTGSGYSWSLRKLQDDVPPYTPKSHMYSRGWTKVVGDIMGVQRGFQFHMRESWAQQEPFQPTEETDRRTKGRVVVQHPHENPLQAALALVCLLAQQNNSCTTSTTLNSSKHPSNPWQPFPECGQSHFGILSSWICRIDSIVQVNRFNLMILSSAF